MRAPLPEKLGGEFWFTIFMIGFFAALGLWGFANSWGYQAAGSSFISLLCVYRLVVHVRKVRLARLLKLNPEIARIYYGRDQ